MTYENQLGIFLTEQFQDLFEDVLKYIMRAFDPLPALPSCRASGFNLNVSANDKACLRKFDKLGISPYQFTFKLTNF